MSLGAARDLSIPDLLRALNEKLDLETSRLRASCLPPIASTQSLTAEIENLETRARDVLNLIPSLWNALQPVNKLPPEIVSIIARYVQNDETPDRTRRIIPLTHVCRYWRMLIISTSGHWTSISTGCSRKLVGLSLKRTSPLDVRVDMRRFQKDNWALDLLRLKIQNIRSLIVLRPRDANDVTTAFPDFPRSMPNLQSLEISNSGGSDWDQSVDPFSPFGSSACSLRCLTLDNILLYPSFLNLRTLTTLYLRDHDFYLHLDTLLDFLEENHSLQRVTLWVSFVEPSLHISQRRSPIRNQLQHLSISCRRVIQAQALITNIALQRGAHLEIFCGLWDAGPNEILTGISTAHLSNLLSPTSIEYETHPRRIRLSGPNGRFSFGSPLLIIRNLFIEFPLLPLANVREFHLIHRETSGTSHLRPAIHHLSLFPNLETLAIECETRTSYLPTLSSDPSSPPSLTTLAFLNCDLSEDFMEELTQFASDRKNTTSARLHRVVIVDSDGKFPSPTSIKALEKHVPIVDVRRGREPPTDLT